MPRRSAVADKKVDLDELERLVQQIKTAQC